MGWFARNFSNLRAPPQTLRYHKDGMTQALHWRLQIFTLHGAKFSRPHYVHSWWKHTKTSYFSKYAERNGKQINKPSSKI